MLLFALAIWPLTAHLFLSVSLSVSQSLSLSLSLSPSPPLSRLLTASSFSLSLCPPVYVVLAYHHVSPSICVALRSVVGVFACSSLRSAAALPHLCGGVPARIICRLCLSITCLLLYQSLTQCNTGSICCCYRVRRNK